MTNGLIQYITVEESTSIQWVKYTHNFPVLQNERLKHVVQEAEEKAESSELQINSISREYRAMLETKEVVALIIL